jgi:hypothetical protein
LEGVGSCGGGCCGRRRRRRPKQEQSVRKETSFLISLPEFSGELTDPFDYWNWCAVVGRGWFLWWRLLRSSSSSELGANELEYWMDLNFAPDSNPFDYWMNFGGGGWFRCCGWLLDSVVALLAKVEGGWVCCRCRCCCRCHFSIFSCWFRLQLRQRRQTESRDHAWWRRHRKLACGWVHSAKRTCSNPRRR